MRLRGLIVLVGLVACIGCSSSLRVGFFPEDAGEDDTDGGSSNPDDAAGNEEDGPSGEAAADGSPGDEWETGTADAGMADAPTDEAPPSDAPPPTGDATLADAGEGSPPDAAADASVVDEADHMSADATVDDAPGEAESSVGATPEDAQAETSAPPIDGGTVAADALADATTQAPDAEVDDAQTEAAPAVDSAGVGADDGQAFDAAADASAVVPVLIGGHYVFSWSNLLLEIDPQTGGRVLTYSLAGQNVLTGPATNAINYGSTFWTSPQSDWGWPPVPEIDNLPYAASVEGGTLTLIGSTNAALGVSVTKAFSVDTATGAVSITYTITNAASAARSFAPWEVTRVAPTGLMFFPTGSTAYSADSGPPLPTTQAGGATWFDADTATTSADTKFFATAARGWLAQASAGLLFVKKFPDVSASAAAPGEAEVEMFASGDGAYVELEAQGAYVAIAPGGTLVWSTTWFLVELPAAVDAGLGSASLVSFVDSL